MQYNFNTVSLEHGKAALLLYAMYRSRNRNSSLNGLETWDRFTAYVRGAALKSTTTAEFVQNFCKMAKVESIKPRFLTAGTSGLTMLSSGAIVESSDIREYKTDIIEDNSLLRIFEKEGVYLTMLVRERIQREKMEYTEDAEEYEND